MNSHTQMHMQPDAERFQYMIDQCKTNKTVWLLQAREELFAMFEDDKNQAYIPIWPDKIYAEMYAIDDWNSYQAISMSWKEFEQWATELNEDDILLAVFPNDKMQVIPIKPLQFTEITNNSSEKSSI